MGAHRKGDARRCAIRNNSASFAPSPRGDAAVTVARSTAIQGHAFTAIIVAIALGLICAGIGRWGHINGRIDATAAHQRDPILARCIGRITQARTATTINSADRSHLQGTAIARVKPSDGKRSRLTR